LSCKKKLSCVVTNLKLLKIRLWICIVLMYSINFNEWKSFIFVKKEKVSYFCRHVYILIYVKKICLVLMRVILTFHYSKQISCINKGVYLEKKVKKIYLVIWKKIVHIFRDILLFERFFFGKGFIIRNGGSIIHLCHIPDQQLPL